MEKQRRNALTLICLALTTFAWYGTPSFAESEPPVTIFTAKKIITMNPMQPEATAVAVKDHRIFAVSSLEDMQSWMKAGSYAVNNQFANDVIIPGFIEAHSHWTLLVTLLQHPYAGYYDFLGYDGQVFHGAKTKDEVLTNLTAAEKKMTNPTEPLIAWNYDPIFYNNEELTVADLDVISKTRPIFVLNASGHIAYVNSVMLARAGINSKTNIVGVMKNAAGNPNGVLREIAAMTTVLPQIVNSLISPTIVKKGIAGAGDLAHRLGLTTVSDLFFGGVTEGALLGPLKNAAANPDYPVRVVLVYDGEALAGREKQTPGQGIAYYQNLQKQMSNKLRMGGLKFVIDGSIQGFTARLNWPGYFNGAPNGILNISPDELKQEALPFWQAGIPLHMHANGDEATDIALNTLAYLQNSAPRLDGLFVIEHDQLSNSEQFARAKRLGAYVNLFTNHLYYWGDQHAAITIGPERTKQMDNTAEAKRNNLMFSIHSDSPVTPLGPLNAMWTAINRVTATGRVMGEPARISAEDALKAVTINAAYLLGLQDEIGSIEIGKRADFTILLNNPLTEVPMKMKDIPVVATISDGKVFAVKAG